MAKELTQEEANALVSLRADIDAIVIKLNDMKDRLGLYVEWKIDNKDGKSILTHIAAFKMETIVIPYRESTGRLDS